MASPPYLSSLPWNPEHASTLVIYCSDNRFGAQTEEFLQSYLRTSRVDRFIIPGGAACLSLRPGTLRDYDVGRRNLELLVEHHGLTRMVLVAHHDCGFYQFHLPDLTEAERRSTQEADLKEALRVLSAWFAGISVEAY